MIDEGDIYGDGVNVAARLENIADRNGICISRQVLDQIEGRIPIEYRELGRQNLKNTARSAMAPRRRRKKFADSKLSADRVAAALTRVQRALAERGEKARVTLPTKVTPWWRESAAKQ